MKLIRRILPVLLLMWGCTEAPNPPTFTMRQPDMNYLEFLSRAEALVEENFPEWYVEGIRRELEFDNPSSNFAEVYEEDDGTLVMAIYELSWDLCAVEDLASVLLHEYVHVKIWDELKEKIPDEFCQIAIHELTAYSVEMNQRKIRTTGAMRRGTRFGYSLAYIQARVFCPQEIIKDFQKPKVHLYGR